MKKTLFILSLFITSFSYSQIQIGADIDGLESNDRLGSSVSTSSDGYTVAISARLHDSNRGHVKVFQNINNVWTQIGADIDGEDTGDSSGVSISLSNDGSIVAIGAPFNDGNGNASGHVRVYQNIGGTWTQIGADIDGEAADDNSGNSVSLSSDGSIVAIGAVFNDGNGNNSGHVRVYQNIGGTWTQIGADIDGEAADDNSGNSVSLSSNGDIVAIGAVFNDRNGSASGHVRVYQNIGGTWTQIGADIDGESSTDQSGSSVSLSSDGSIVAIGAPYNDGNGSNSGHVRVYQNIGGTWTQIGTDIDGEAAGDESGWSVDLSSNGNIIAIGAPLNQGVNGPHSGHARLYQNIGGTWTQIDSDIDGGPTFEELGTSISLSSDGSIVATGSPNGNSFSGFAQVFRFSNTWTGATDNDWDTASNWSLGSIPTGTSDVVIPFTFGVKFPTATGAIAVNNMTINEGAKLTVNGALTNNGAITINSRGTLIAKTAVSGTVTYNHNIETTNWHLISSPVSGQDIDAFASAEGLASGTGNNRGLATYNNTTPGPIWTYYQDGASGSGNFIQGEGRSLKLATTQDISFSGSMPVSDVSIPISSNTSTFNLVGNPYPSYIYANTNADATNNILTINSANLTEETLWFWNEGTNSYDVVNQVTGLKLIAPTEGFFVSASGNKTFNFTEAMQTHLTSNFFRTSRPEIKLSLSNGEITKTTDIFYINKITTGWDNGYDSSLFAGADNSFAVYTQLLTNNTGKNLKIQSLPDSDYESMVIPVGVNAVSGTEISFSATSMNLPNGINLYLEDKELNSFTSLSNVDETYTVTLSSDQNGIGRFYLHTSATALSATSEELEAIKIHTTTNNNIRITGIEKGIVKLKAYNAIGNSVANTSFKAKGTNNVKLPELSTGVYIIHLETEKGKLNKKIIIE